MMEKAESMRHLACAPPSWWEFTTKHATHIYNRTPMHRIGWKTPYELIYNEKLSIDHLRVFVCSAYVHLPDVVRKNKESSRAEISS